MDDKQSVPASGRPAAWVWIDLEMTGLDPHTCQILEIASVVTDGDLNVIAEGPDIVIHHPDDVLAGMNAWCQEQHAASGLVDQVVASGTSLRAAEQATVAFLADHVPPGQAPLCGNSIGLDWRFLMRHMPDLTAFLGADLIDVSTVKELARRWYPGALPPAKGDTHRAREDILESIAELRFYRDQLFRAPDGPLQSRT